MVIAAVLFGIAVKLPFYIKFRKFFSFAKEEIQLKKHFITLFLTCQYTKSIIF